ncbi:MAG: hypothetical protein ABL966_11030 [Acidimicrobiales bacterium]
MRLVKDRRTRGDRGATLPEYALIVALIVITCLSGIQMVQENGEEKLAASDGRISAADGAYYPGGATTTSTPGPTTTAPPTPIGVHLAANPTVVVADVSGNKWQVTVTFTLRDSANNGVIGATMNGVWSGGGNGSDPVGSCTTSTSAGQCTVQFTKIRDSVPNVTYTVSTITGGTFSWTPAATGEGTLTVNCGAVC